MGDALIEDLLANPTMWDYDPQQRAYRRASDKSLVTESAFVSYTGAAPKRGRVHVLSTPPPNNTTVMWRSQKRFTYVAIYVTATQLWYISGTGQQYGGNEHSDHTLRAILRDELTDGVSIVKMWDDLDV